MSSPATGTGSGELRLDMVVGDEAFVIGDTVQEPLLRRTGGGCGSIDGSGGDSSSSFCA